MILKYFKVNNRNNILPILLYYLYLIFVLHFYFFKIESFQNYSSCGTGYMMIGLAIFTPVLSIILLLILALINFLSKKRYYTDYEFISLSLLFLIGMLFFKIFI
jgi:hypothetical protein